ncbi:MAG: NAD(P)/FAD-dependent oxidoreductase [Chloroflexales bacterium]|nr:NAD(P)/FAD-dependent oxidoreductase [Chloroflexales bacterium]
MATAYVIVGSGVAGIAAAETLRARDPGAGITLVSEDPAGFYSRPGLAYYLSGLIPDRQLFPRSPEALRALNLTWVQTRVDGIEPQAQRLTLAGGRRLPYDRLLLATGARAAPPDFPGGALDGVVTLDTLDDARRLVRRARRGVHAVVVGGGITALELAEGLHARGCHVHYLLRGARYWANVLDAEESQLVEARLRAAGITLHHHTQVREVIGTRGKLSAVETTGGARIPCQILAVAIGTRPRLELARGAELGVERGILADEYLQTSVPTIFAAGDGAQVRDPRTGQASLDTLWPTARAHGEAAALNMAGTPTRYQRTVAMNVTLLAGLPTTLIGALGAGGDDADLVAIARGDSETWRAAAPAWVVVERHEVNRVRLVLGERCLRGALVMGDQTLSRPLQRLIAAEADVTPIRSALLASGADVPSVLHQFCSAWEATNGPDR